MPTSYDRYEPRYPIGAYLWPLLLVLIVAGLLIWRFGGFNFLSWQSGPTALPKIDVEPAGKLSDLEESIIKLYEKASPSVVHVTNLTDRRGVFSTSVQQVPRGTGSGFIWPASSGTDAYIVTNNHVVADADAVQVVLDDHSAYSARSVWVNPDKDLAVIWITVPRGKKLVPIEVTSSRGLKVGQLAYAIGNPFGLDHTLTNGIVSALGRDLEGEGGRPLRGLIQTSAAINPGNSGGPLLNSSAQLIGVNTAILSPSGASAGIGFAIPSDEVVQVVEDLIAHIKGSAGQRKRGTITTPRLGVQLADDKVARNLGVASGALVLKVVPDSPADQAGLQGTRIDQDGQVHLGDVIVAIDGKKVEAPKDMAPILQQHKPGDKVKVTIRRDGKEQDVEVTLEAPSGS
jgi:S1-C subfamily serine protease